MLSIHTYLSNHFVLNKHILCAILTICVCATRITSMEPEPIYKEIGGIIRAQRRLADKAQNVLAGQLGISRATLANMETGRQRILVHQLYAIAKALKIKLSDLLPPLRDEDLGVNWETLPIEGDVNEEQRKQIASLIGPISEQLTSSKKVKGRDAKTLKRKSGRPGTKASR